MASPTYMTQGGWRTASIYSGIIAGVGLTAAPGAVNVGSDTLFMSGPGRLNSVIPHATYTALSGVGVTFYDAPAAVSGGPLFTSGHRTLGALPGAFGVSGQIVPAGQPIHLNVPFTSGLCASNRSGAVGYTLVFSKETNNNF